MDNKEKILNIIHQGSLNSEEMELWEQVVGNLADELCPDVIWFLENTPNGLRMMTENIKEKLVALRSGDMAAWEAVLQKEGKFLKSLAE